MKLTCKKTIAHHYGIHLQEGKEYQLPKPFYKSITIITNHKNYLEETIRIAKWVNKPDILARLDDTKMSKEEKEILTKQLNRNLPEVETQISIKERNKLYTKDIEVPFIQITTDLNSTMDFCTLTNAELIELGADTKDDNKIAAIQYTIHMIDDYFDYYPQRRDTKLNKLIPDNND